jgi:electron transport complex protein RnfE
MKPVLIGSGATTMRAIREFTKGIWGENPVLRIILGMCPTLAVSTSVKNAVGMGISVIFVLTMSNLAISMFRKMIPNEVRIPCFIILIATFVTVTELCLKAYAFELYKNLGIFLPLIVVNCIILGRAEAFASKNNVFYSVIDGLGMGTGFTLALVTLASIREILGNGTFFGVNVMGSSFEPVLVMILPPGAFIGLGFLLAGMNKIEAIRKR